MELIELTPEATEALRARGLSPATISAIRLIVSCLEEVCGWVADDCGPARHDDATSEGGLRWRRTRNYAREILKGGQFPELVDVTADLSDNAIQLLADGCAVSFYSARNGISQPDLSGPSKTKQRVVDEMQLQLAVDVPDAPERVVVLYEADEDGLVRAAVGMLDSATSWSWEVNVFARSGIRKAPVEDGWAVTLPEPYDTLPEPDLGDIEPIEEDADTGEQHLQE